VSLAFELTERKPGLRGVETFKLRFGALWLREVFFLQKAEGGTAKGRDGCQAEGEAKSIG
jgi:hypothetical protein